MVDKTKTKTKTKTKKRRTRRPNNTTAKKYIGRDKIKDSSIKININTGGSGGSGGSKSTAPPAVNVYPQQHLIQDRYDRTPLIDDKIGTSNLMQLLTDKHNNDQRKTRELMDKQYQEQQQYNERRNNEIELITNEQNQLSIGQNKLLDIAQTLYKPSMMLKDKPEQPDISLFQPPKPELKPALVGNNGVLMTPIKTKKLIEVIGEKVEIPEEFEMNDMSKSGKKNKAGQPPNPNPIVNVKRKSAGRPPKPNAVVKVKKYENKEDYYNRGKQKKIIINNDVDDI